MTSDRRVLVDNDSRTLAHMVDGLHDVAGALGERRFAIVGGIAVLTHVQGHRVTQDIDSAVRGLGQEIREALLVVAGPDHTGKSDGLLTNGVPVDLLVVGHGGPKPSSGRGRQARQREATGHAIRWAIDSARVHELVCAPENSRGPVTVPVADVAALLAMKAIALTDPSREAKAVTDRLDLWLLLTHDLDRATAGLQQLCDAPAPARRWTAEVFVELLRDDPSDLLGQIADGFGAPRSVEDVDDVWHAVVQPHLDDLRR